MDLLPAFPLEADGHRKKLGGSGAPLGFVTQLKVVDQWQELEEEKSLYKTPSAACGYFAAVNALAFSQMKLPGTIESSKDLCRWTSALNWLARPDHVRLATADFMKDLMEEREKYANDCPENFPEPAARSKYISDWVANYEISDRLQRYAARI